MATCHSTTKTCTTTVADGERGHLGVERFAEWSDGALTVGPCLIRLMVDAAMTQADTMLLVRNLSQASLLTVEAAA